MSSRHFRLCAEDYRISLAVAVRGGSARASALATVDRRYNSNALIVADLSNDATYAEVLLDTFGGRVIGLQISRKRRRLSFAWVRKHSFDSKT